MKKQGILNSEISKILSDMGHTDTIVIADCGLPIPAGVKKIDVAIKMGMPTFLDVLEELEKDMVIEVVTLATEIKDQNAHLHKILQERYQQIEYITHEEFKQETQKAKAIVRTGEVTPYANIILRSGVIF